MLLRYLILDQSIPILLHTESNGCILVAKLKSLSMYNELKLRRISASLVDFLLKDSIAISFSAALMKRCNTVFAAIESPLQ